MNLQDRRATEIRRLQGEARALEQVVSHRRTRYAGLVDLGEHHRLIALKTELSGLLLSDPAGGAESHDQRKERHHGARTHFVQALGLYEEIQHANVSLEQAEAVRASEENLDSRRRIAGLLRRHADVLLHQEQELDPSVDVAGVVARAIRKYASPEEHYKPLVVKDEVPALLKDLVEGVLGNLMEAHRSEGDVGVQEEGEDPEVVSSQSMAMPLSQAIVYYEEELIPQTEEALREEPGDPLLQRLLARRRREAEAMRDLRIHPRARPPTWESNLWDVALTQFTEAGEPMIKVPLAVTQTLGTNLDRVQELVQMEVVRQLAGQGVDALLDKETAPVTLLGAPGGRVDYAAWYRLLCFSLPALACVADRELFRHLLDTARREPPGALERMVAGLVGRRGGGAGELGTAVAEPER